MINVYFQHHIMFVVMYCTCVSVVEAAAAENAAINFISKFQQLIEHLSRIYTLKVSAE